MATHTVKGRTIEEAVAKAMNDLNVEREQLVYDVVEQPNKGFLGIFGVKPAVIEVRVKPSSARVASTFLKETISLMGIEVELDEQKKGKDLTFNLLSVNETDQGRLIGKKGQTLDSLEYLANLAVVQAGTVDFARIQLDAGGYRKKREETLRELAVRVSKKAQQSQESVVLEPMPARERKVIHTALANEKGVKTESKGAGQKRHVVVDPS